MVRAVMRVCIRNFWHSVVTSAWNLLPASGEIRNRYSVPPKLQNANVFIRANATQVRVIANGEVAACHARSYDRNQLISLPDHRLEALKLRSRVRARDIEEAFDALGEEARKFHLELRRLPVKTNVHLRRLLNLVHLYGRQDVVAAIARANQWLTFDAAYVETDHE